MATSKRFQSGLSTRAVRTIVAASFSLAGAGTSAWADTIWTGATSQDWSNPANWTNGVPLDASDNGAAIIDTSTGNYPIYSSGTTGTDFDVFLGRSAPARMDQTGGTLQVGNGSWMFLGDGNTATYNLTGSGTPTLNAGALNVGAWSAQGSFGTFNLNAPNGVLNATAGNNRPFGFGDASILVGENGNSGVVNISAGTANAAFSTIVGSGNGNAGTTGTLNVSGSGVLNTTGNLQVGRSNGTGALTQSGGTITTSNESWIGTDSTGTMNMSGGTFTSNGYISIGRTAGGNGTFNLTGGTVNSATTFGFTSVGSGGGTTGVLNVSGTGIYNATTGGMIVGEGWNGTTTAKGTVTVSGGELRLGTNALQLGLNALGDGTINLDGGVLSAGSVTKGAGAGTFNFNGGTLRPTADSAAFLAGPITQVRNGGAVVDTNGFAVTIGEAIVHSAVSGDNAADGGLTKTGSGTLTLTGVNGYTGVTTVKAGTLKVNYSSILATASTPVLTGGGADLQNGSLVIDYTGSPTPAATVRGLLAASFQATTTPGVMDTGKIRSATATLKRGIGYADDGTGGVTLRATLFGDADLDGGVSINDFNALAGNFGQATGRVWTQGDFDYDGGVSINDFNLLAGNFGQTLPASSEAWAGLLAFAAAHNDLETFTAITGVPEPTSLGLIAAGLTLGLRRRRSDTK